MSFQFICRIVQNYLAHKTSSDESTTYDFSKGTKIENIILWEDNLSNGQRVDINVVVIEKDGSPLGTWLKAEG